jgi:hypothetical protein
MVMVPPDTEMVVTAAVPPSTENERMTLSPVTQVSLDVEVAIVAMMTR